MSETKLTNACLEWLWEHGIPAFRVNSGNVFVGKRMVRGAPPGTPDIIGWWPITGGMFTVENKIGKSGLRPAQKAWHSKFARYSSPFGVVDSIIAWSLAELEVNIMAYAALWKSSLYSGPMLRELLSAPTKEKAGLARIAPKGRIVDESNFIPDLGADELLRRPRRPRRAK